MRTSIRCALLAVLVSARAGAGAEGFEPPTEEAARAAVGALAALPAAQQRLLAVDEDFRPIEAPELGDWLAHHAEAGQTFDDFVESGASPFTAQRDVIYLQPLGTFAVESSPSLEALEEYAAVFFQMDVVLLAPQAIAAREFRPRIHGVTGKPQLLSPAVLGWLRDRLPADAHCLIGVTMIDLYPAESWNFVFGQASLRDRVGVFSFARYDAAFFGEARPEDFERLMLQRSARTLVHEIGHTFGMRHCIYFRCVENGTNHQTESDSRPHHLCPVCLRKLQYATGLDLERRYHSLDVFYIDRGWADEAEWVGRQLAKARAVPPVLTPPALPAWMLRGGGAP